jgi:hypothetical protein
MPQRIGLVQNGVTKAAHGPGGRVDDLARALLFNDEQEAAAVCAALNAVLGVMDEHHCYRVQLVPADPPGPPATPGPAIRGKAAG